MSFASIGGMTTKNVEPARRQVTPQPQELPPGAGQPRVPHTRVKQPGEDAPDSERQPAPQRDESD
jgi:hypothetical protein